MTASGSQELYGERLPILGVLGSGRAGEAVRIGDDGGEEGIRIQGTAPRSGTVIRRRKAGLPIQR
jgi:hypothetical protein